MEDKTIIMRQESFVLMLDFTDFSETEIANFFIAFGKEVIFHSQFMNDVWNVERSGLTEEVDWNGLKSKIEDLFIESWEIGTIYDLEGMKHEFERVFNDKKILNMLSE